MAMIHQISYLLLFLTTSITATNNIHTNDADSLSPLPETCQEDVTKPIVSTTDDEQPPSTSSISLPLPFTYDSNTGSAQAYKPNCRIKNSVCGALTPITKNHYEHKVANRWLPWRSVRKSPAPIVNVYGRLLDVDSENQNIDNNCQNDGLVFTSDNDHSSYVEVWQAFPDGTYSSLLSPALATSSRSTLQQDGHNDDGICRARVPLLKSSDRKNRPISFEFKTLAPGATGALSGLGPGGWDMPPWKLPVIHVLIWLDGYQLSLIEIPIIPRGSKTKESSNDHFSSVEDTNQQSYNWGTASFHWDDTRDELDVEVDIKMKRSHVSHEADLKDILCQQNAKNWWYPSSPGSFFLEPITLCRPFLLDFFPL